MLYRKPTQHNAHVDEKNGLLVPNRMSNCQLQVNIICLAAINGRRQWHPTPVLLPGKSHGRRAWWAIVHGVAKSQTRLSDFTFTFLSECLIAVENGNPLQDSCLENCMHRGIWWATVHGVTKSGSQLSTRINTQCLKHGSCFKQNSAHII